MVDRASEGSDELVSRVLWMAEVASGLPVHVVPEQGLTVFSSLTIGRGEMSGHVVR